MKKNYGPMCAEEKNEFSFTAC